MKKINLINIITSIALSLSVTGCGKSFLEVSPTNTLPRETYITDLQSSEQLMLSMYPMLGKAYGTYSEIYPELAADNLKPVTGSSNFLRMYSWQQIPDSKTSDTNASALNLNGLSYNYYKLISTCNFLLEKIPGFAQENPAKADEMLGVSLTIRAYSYFMLVNLFAQPYNYSADASHPGLVYSSTSDIHEPVKGRATVAEVYQHILEDLERAAKLLPENSANLLLINRKLAIALLSRAYLHKGDYEASLRQAQVSIQRKPLLTIAQGYPDDIFKNTNSAQNEAFFLLVPASSKLMGWTGSGQFANLYYQQSQQFVATKDIADIIAENNQDIRFKWLAVSPKGWKITKYPTGVISDIPAVVSYFKPVARSSEMYLNAAEACFYLHKEDSARYYLNAIIQRATPDAVPVQLTGEPLRDAIRKERRKELAFEGGRLFDLLRWKQDIVRSDPSVSDASRLPYPNDKAIAPLPLPDVAKSGVVQNPGYY